MKFVTTATLAALLLGSISVSGLVPAYADDAAAQPAAATPAAPTPPAETLAATDDGPNRPGPWMRFREGQFGRPGQMRNNLLDIACGDRGAEALEIAFVHVQYSVKPTAEQQPLLDALKTTALADQKNFADACKAATGDGGTAKATILDRFQTRLAIDTAKVTALNDVLPKFKAFYDSLTDQQKQVLEPRRGNGPRMGFNGAPGRWARPDRGAMMGPTGRMHGMPGPDAMQPDAAPPTAPATPDATPTPDTQG